MSEGGAPARWTVLALALALPGAPLAAQHAERGEHGGPAGAPLVRLGGQAVPLVTHVAPGPEGVDRTEGALTQVMLMAAADPWRGRLFARLTLNGEGRTMRRGELDTGIYGEGYVDRRHPHTYLHEAMVGARATVLGTDLSVAGGKGFAPFGTDDPMSRPFAKYPINHHLSQILERAVVIAGIRRGAVTLEGARFGGDEPVGPGDPPRADRLADSWSARLTVAPRPPLELSASWASVRSPEFPSGEGLDHRQWNAAARWEAPARGPLLRYALLEVGRTDEYFGALRTFRFGTTLAEATLDARVADLSLRVERTVRPEEERLLDPFRTPRPLPDFGIIGKTRWDALTVNVARPLAMRVGAAVPFVELSLLRPRAVLSPTAFEPRDFYRARTLAMASAGVRLSVGHIHPRMGRYGVAERAAPMRHVSH